MNSHRAEGDVEFSDELCMQPAYLWAFQINQQHISKIFQFALPSPTRYAQSWIECGVSIGRRQRQILLSRSCLGVLLAQRLTIFRNEYAVRMHPMHAARILSQRHVSGLKNESVGGMSCILTLLVHEDGSDTNNKTSEAEPIMDFSFHPSLPVLATASIRAPRLWCIDSECSKATHLATLIQGDEPQALRFVKFHPILPIVATQGDCAVKLWRFGLNPPFASFITILEHRYDQVLGQFSDSPYCQNRPTGAAFHPRLAILATSTHDGNVMLWHFDSDYTAASCVAVLEVKPASDGPLSLKNVVFHPFLPLLAASSNHEGATLWELSSDGKSATIIASMQEHNAGLKCVTFHPKLPFMGTASRDWTAKLWQLNYESTSVERDHTRSVVTCVSTLGEGWSAFQQADPVHNEEKVSECFGDDANVDQVDVYGGNTAANQFGMWIDENGEFDEYRWHATMRGHCGSVKYIEFHPKLPIAATCGKDRVAKLWSLNRDGTTAIPITSLHGHEHICHKAKFHPRLPILGTCSLDGTVKLWR
jgi:WD40 repeat protein